VATKKTDTAKDKKPAKTPAKAKAPAKTAKKTVAAKKEAAPKKTGAAVKKAAPKKPAKAAVQAPAPRKSPAQCIFDLYDLKFGMNRAAVTGLLDLTDENQLLEKQLKKAGASMIELFFDHLDRLWQVKAWYPIMDEYEAEALLDRMSKDYRFQTPSARIAFELSESDNGQKTLYIRYTEANFKRMYLHHMMAVGAAKLEAEEERARIIKEKEEEEYIPTGPLMF